MLKDVLREDVAYHRVFAVTAEPTKLRKTKQKAGLPPPFYQVVMLNDDFTPMDFVVEVLQHYFYKSLEEATLVMLQIHHEGKGICGVYPKDIAQTKIELVMSAARKAQHPLQCTMETI